jgi:farnesyl-diphosphate farnesyltransferase
VKVASLLRPVSRSFYLSLQLLPRPLREPVSLAYLLARTTDTVADTARVPTELRIETLDKVRALIQGEPDAKQIVDLTAQFAPLQQNAAERALIEALPATLAQLDQLDPTDREEIRALLQKITSGQRLDLQRFHGSTEVRALATVAELDEYTYLVAGCVGEFWTRLCFSHLQNFTRRTEEEMLALGKQYGMGLQLINILRDAGADLRAGRCYFPEQELRAIALTPAQITQHLERFLPVYEKWLDKAECGVTAGVEYSLAIRNNRVRAATVVPALIGRRTLALLRTAGANVWQRTIKVPREEVRAMIAQLAITLSSRRMIEKLAASGYKK